MDGGRIGTLSFDLVTVSSKKIISNKLCKKVKKLSKLNQKRWGVDVLLDKLKKQSNFKTLNNILSKCSTPFPSDLNFSTCQSKIMDSFDEETLTFPTVNLFGEF